MMLYFLQTFKNTNFVLFLTTLLENKQKINERRKRNQAKLTPEQIEEKTRKAKEYREQNKAKRKEKSSQKIKCLVCKSILSRQCWKRHTTSSFHTEAYKLNPNLDEDFEIVDNTDNSNDDTIKHDETDINFKINV